MLARPNRGRRASDTLRKPAPLGRELSVAQMPQARTSVPERSVIAYRSPTHRKNPVGCGRDPAQPPNELQLGRVVTDRVRSQCNAHGPAPRHRPPLLDSQPNHRRSSPSLSIARPRRSGRPPRACNVYRRSSPPARLRDQCPTTRSAQPPPLNRLVLPEVPPMNNLSE